MGQLNKVTFPVKGVLDILFRIRLAFHTTYQRFRTYFAYAVHFFFIASKESLVKTFFFHNETTRFYANSFARFNMNFDPNVTRKAIERFFKRRYFDIIVNVAFEFNVNHFDFIKRQILYRAFSRSCTVNGSVVHNDEFSIFCALNVKFNLLRSGTNCCNKRRHGVFWRDSLVASVCAKTSFRHFTKQV